MPGGAKRHARYRISPTAIGYWRGGEFCILNFATKAEIRAEAFVARLLSVLGDWRTVAEVSETIAFPHTAALGRLLEHLARTSIVQREHARLPRAERAFADWGSWNPAAGLFHAMSSGVTYVENDAPGGARGRTRPPSQPVVNRAGARIRLTVPTPSDAFATTVLSRRTWRRFGDTDIPRSSVDTLLWFTAGVQGWLHAPRGEKLPLTTSPSGGARHPIEVFVYARHVDGLRSGLYRYDGARHTLRAISPPPASTREYLPRQYWYEDAALILFLCGTFGSTRARYPYPRAYRAVLLEAGHVCQTFCLAATWLGLAPFCTMALDDRRIERDLGLDGVTTAVLYAAGVGAKPSRGLPAAPRGQRHVTVSSAQRRSPKENR
jgi:SagB-type dehydrogenase family enzyme